MKKIFKFHQGKNTYYIDISNIFGIREYNVPIPPNEFGNPECVGEIMDLNDHYIWIEKKEDLDKLIKLYYEE